MPNRLQNETSPYLRQHAENPVDWYPWCREAFQKAKAEDKPVFLSIGYSTCHWCHVMAHESFEDPEIARLLNEGFVSIKVDREERPDIDSLYMAACQAFTGSGGWPTTLFLTPEQKPFFAGTYFPKDNQRGLVGLRQLLPTAQKAWKENRETLLSAADQASALLQGDSKPAGTPPDAALLQKALTHWQASFDTAWGGFGSAPKFPMGHSLLCLLTFGEKTGDPVPLAMAEKTLTRLYQGGIFDHIGGGFSRYSTDRQFLIPHFEKMLYDNALLILAYCKAYALTRKPLYKEVAERTADYVLRELTLPSGAFASAQDADSDGEEGSYYTFRPEEILRVLGDEDGEVFNRCYHITPQGDFQGKSIPHLLPEEEPPQLPQGCLETLLAYRRQRRQLHRDDKVLTGWNGLMIAALAWLYRVTGEARYRDAALKNWDYLKIHHQKDGQLFASSLEGKTGPRAFLEDYVFLSFGLIALYEATQDMAFLHQALPLVHRVLEDFPDQERGGFYLTAKDSEPLLTRPKETADGALPSGNTMLAMVLLRLAQLSEERRWEVEAERQLSFLAGQADSFPTAYPVYLLTLLAQMHPPESVTVAAPTPEDLPQQPWPFPLDAMVRVLPQPTGDYPLINGKTTYYVCRNNTCQPPRNTYDA